MIPEGTKEFTANGKTYRIESSLSFDRWRDMQRIEAELSFASTMEQQREGIKRIYQALNAKEGLADAAVIAKNMLIGAASIDEKWIPTILKLCALFVNEVDEDRRTITQAQIEAKIRDWNEEGIEAVSFFKLALGVLPGYASAYRDASRIGSGGAVVEDRQTIKSS